MLTKDPQNDIRMFVFFKVINDTSYITFEVSSNVDKTKTHLSNTASSFDHHRWVELHFGKWYMDTNCALFDDTRVKWTTDILTSTATDSAKSNTTTTTTTTTKATTHIKDNNNDDYRSNDTVTTHNNNINSSSNNNNREREREREKREKEARANGKIME